MTRNRKRRKKASLLEKHKAWYELTEKAAGLTRVVDEERLEIKMLAYLARMGDPKTRELAAKVIASDHIESKFMSDWVESISKISVPHPYVEKWLRFIRENNPNERVQGMATFALLRHMQKLTRSTKQRNAYAKAIGEEGKEYIASRSRKKSEEAVEWLAKSILEDFRNAKLGSVRALGVAKSIMNAKRLKIGKIAPEIEGKDLDGVTFKLSDYRGKVVVIDFWGDW